MGGYLFLLHPSWKIFLNRYNFLLWMEWIAVWAFAAAWLIKGHAILADIAVNIVAFPAKRLSVARRPHQA